MIELNNLDVELVDLTTDELESIHGSDSFGAIITGVSAFSAGGVVSDGDPVKAIKAGAAGTSFGQLIPVLANPTVGIPTSIFFGTAIGIAEGLSPSSMSNSPFPGASYSGGGPMIPN